MCFRGETFQKIIERGYFTSLPIGSMYGIFTYIWLIFMVNVGKHTSPMDPMGYKWFVYWGELTDPITFDPNKPNGTSDPSDPWDAGCNDGWTRCTKLGFVKFEVE